MNDEVHAVRMRKCLFLDIYVYNGIHSYVVSIFDVDVCLRGECSPFSLLFTLCGKVLEKKKAEKLLQKLQLEKLQLSEIRETLTDEENLSKQRYHRAPLRDLTVPEADAGSPRTEHRLRNSLELENADIESGHHLSTMAASAVITPKSDSESDDEFFDAASDLALASLSEHGIAGSLSLFASFRFRYPSASSCIVELLASLISILVLLSGVHWGHDLTIPKRV